jgi:hypothetical protein
LWYSLISVISKMNYVFTRHALRRMQKRGITEDDVQYCTDNYNMSYPGEGDCVQYIADVRGRNLKVVVNTVKAIVVTAVWVD